LHLQGAGSLQARLAAAAAAGEAPATLHRIGRCDGAAAGAPLKGHPLPDLAALNSSAALPAVVLVCATSEDALEDQAAVLKALGDAVVAAEARHLFVYASEPVVRNKRIVCKPSGHRLCWLVDRQAQ